MTRAVAKFGQVADVTALLEGRLTADTSNLRQQAKDQMAIRMDTIKAYSDSLDTSPPSPNASYSVYRTSASTVWGYLPLISRYTPAASGDPACM